MKKRITAILLSAVLVFSLLPAITQTAEAATQKERLVLATGGTSGTYYTVGRALQNVLNSKLQYSEIITESTGASRANINMMTDGEAQLAIVQSDVLNYAHEGTFTFADTGAETSALWVAGLYNETVQIVARPGINTVSDLRGKTVVVGDIGSGTEINAWQILGAVGLTGNNIYTVNESTMEGLDDLKNGWVDAVFTVAGAPTTSIVDYAVRNTLNLVSLSSSELAAVTRAYPFFIEDKLAAGTYWGYNKEVTCVAVQAALVADESVSERAVYELLEAIFDHQDELAGNHAKWGLLSRETCLENTAPLHPGAYKYYNNIPLDSDVSASVAEGTVMAGTEVALTAADGAVIYYTLDGSAPRTSSARYTAPIRIDADTTIRAAAYRDGAMGEAATFSYRVVSKSTAALFASQERGAAGREVSVTVSLANNPGLVNLRLNVGYDKSAMTLVSVTDSGALSGQLHSDNLDASPYRLYWDNSESHGDLTANGTLVTLTFRIKSGARVGNYPITLTLLDAYNYNLDTVPLSIVNGTIAVCKLLCGDADGNGTVNSRDAMVLLRYLVEWPGYDEMLDPLAADVDNDGAVTVADGMVLLRHLANWKGYEKLPLGGNEKIVKIGVFEPLSGDNSAGGERESLGMLYANYVQPTVTIGGEEYQVQLEFVDNRTTAENGPSAAAELVNRGVSVVLGSYGSGVSMAGGAVFSEAGIPAIGVTCTNPQVTSDCDVYYRICYLDPFQGTVLANYAYRELGVTTAYTLAMLGSDYDQGLVYYFTEAFKALGGKVISEDFREGSTGFASYINNAKSAGAGVIFAPVFASYARQIIEAAAARGYKGVLLSSDTWDNSMVVESARGKNVDVEITTFYQEGGNPGFDKGIKAWMNANPDALAINGGSDKVSDVTAMGYDAYFTALQAIEKAGSTDPEAVLRALPSVSYEGVSGRIEFDEIGDARRDCACIKTVNTKTGAWEFVKVQSINEPGGGTEPIKLGWMGALTGDQAAYGICESQTLKLLVEKKNAEGGIHGRPIKLICYDTEGDAQEAVNVARRLCAQDKVCAILGPNSSGQSIAIQSVLNEYHVPALATVATNERVTVQDGVLQKYNFRVCFLDPEQGRIAAVFAYDILGLDKVAVLSDAYDDYSQALRSAFIETFTEKGGRIVANKTYNGGTADFSAQLAAIRNTGAQLIFTPIFYYDFIMIHEQAHSLGMYLPMLGCDGCALEGLFDAASAVNGSYVVNHVSLDDPSTESWRREYSARWNGAKMEINGYLAYDAFQLWCAAVEKAGSDDPEAITRAYTAVEADGITGPFRLAPATHNPVGKRGVVEMIDGTNRKFRFVASVAAD